MGAPPSPPKPSVKSLSCPNCGGTVELRGLGQAVNAVCIQCLSIIDVSDPKLSIVQKFKAKERVQPLIPLGTRGKVRGDLFEVIGFQVRQMESDGVAYSWREYVLFNPYKGFRYLTEYNGHWNVVTVLTAAPTESRGVARRTASVLGETFRHFQTYQARTTYVMGEFPWQVRVGETADCNDFVHPPRILSSESAANEINWSMGEYTPGMEIWQGFGLKGSPPQATGVFANQPSPHTGSVGLAWGRWLVWMIVLTGIQIFFAGIHSNKVVFKKTYQHMQKAGGQNAFVTEVFELPGRTSNVEVALTTTLSNAGAFFQMTLINADTNVAHDFSRVVSYYSGRDSDGSWSEGSSRASVILSSIPSGRYFLRLEPEMLEASNPNSYKIDYAIQVRRDVTTWNFYLIGMLLLLIPPVFASLRSASFEGKRWAESDYAASSSSNGSDDDE